MILGKYIYCIEGVVIAAMHCDLFKIYCALLNLDITRTWIFRLNFAQRPIFFGLEVLQRAWSLRPGTPSLKSFPEDVLRIFTYWKNTSTSAGFKPANLLILRRARYSETTERSRWPHGQQEFYLMSQKETGAIQQGRCLGYVKNK